MCFTLSTSQKFEMKNNCIAGGVTKTKNFLRHAQGEISPASRPSTDKEALSRGILREERTVPR